MAKTIIVPRHAHGPAVNGHDGCYGRGANDGFCPGIRVAQWLNSLGDDSDTYTEMGGVSVSIGALRDSWLKNSVHIIAQNPHLSHLRSEERRLSAELRIVKQRIKQAEEAA